MIRSEKGFSILELLIAISLLAVGLLFVAEMQVVAINKNAFANKITVSTQMAQGVMEEILSQDAGSALFDIPNTYTYDLDLTSTATTRFIEGVGTFSATYIITPNTPVTNVTRVSVTVSTIGRSVTLVSFKRSV